MENDLVYESASIDPGGSYLTITAKRDDGTAVNLVFDRERAADLLAALREIAAERAT